MSLNTTAAIPYFYAAGVQVLTAVTAQIAGYYTKNRFDALLAQTMSYQPLRHGGIIPEGTPKGTLIPEELAPATVLGTASRDRDIATIFTGVVFVAAPVALTYSTSQVSMEVALIALLGVALLLAFGTWFYRRRSARRNERLGVLVTNLAVAILVAINLAIGVHTLLEPDTSANCPATATINPTQKPSVPASP